MAFTRALCKEILRSCFEVMDVYVNIPSCWLDIRPFSHQVDELEQELSPWHLLCHEDCSASPCCTCFGSGNCRFDLSMPFKLPYLYYLNYLYHYNAKN